MECRRKLAALYRRCTYVPDATVCAGDQRHGRQLRHYQIARNVSHDWHYLFLMAEKISLQLRETLRAILHRIDDRQMWCLPALTAPAGRYVQRLYRVAVFRGRISKRLSGGSIPEAAFRERSGFIIAAESPMRYNSMGLLLSLFELHSSNFTLQTAARMAGSMCIVRPEPQLRLQATPARRTSRPWCRAATRS
jgi:hypothetical protein